MKKNFQHSLALSLFLTLGNAQESSLPPSTVYATQGNVVKRQSLDEAEMQAAVQAARQDKALKAAMATYSQPQQVITTPAQFLAANPPRVPAARSGEVDLADSLINKEEEVPEFEPVTAGSASAPSIQSPIPVQGVSPAKVGFFEKLKAKSRSKGSAGADNPYALHQPALPESISNSGEAVSALPGQGVKKGPFGGIFKRPTVSPAAALPGPVVGAPPVAPGLENVPVGSEAPANGAETVADIPVPNGPGAPPPGASIFVPRQSATLSGTVASLKSTTDADVGGVIVSIREGTQVGILSQQGGIATIQLPDQRIGTIKASALSR